jgi:hypothetical protein
MKFKVIGHTDDFDCIIEPIDVSEAEAEKNNILPFGSKYRADLLISGDIETDKNLTHKEKFETLFKDKIVEIERLYPYIMIAYGVKILD